MAKQGENMGISWQRSLHGVMSLFLACVCPIYEGGPGPLNVLSNYCSLETVVGDRNSAACGETAAGQKGPAGLPQERHCQTVTSCIQMYLWFLGMPWLSAELQGHLVFQRCPVTQLVLCIWQQVCTRRQLCLSVAASSS